VEVIGGAPELWVAGSTVIVVTPVMAAMAVVVGCDIVVCGVGGGFGGCGVGRGRAGVVDE
jgi:hypothetical protein